MNVEASSTPLAAAKALIRPYVERGDPIGWYLGRRLGYWGETYGASIGAVMTENGEWRALVPEQIVVSHVRGQPCAVIFPLLEVWEAVEAETRSGRRQRRLC